MEIPHKSRVKIRQYLWNWPHAYSLAYALYRFIKALAKAPERFWVYLDHMLLLPAKRWYNLKEAKKSYASNPISSETDSFVLYRILGNDLPPRHQPGQTLRNLEFMLKHEPDLQDCKKVWVLNRIVNAGELQRLKSLLDAYGKSYFEIPFDQDAYLNIVYQEERDPGMKELLMATDDPQTKTHRLIAEAFRLSRKTLYVMNINGAKNTAMRQGRGLAKWICPWDGNCFLTKEAWETIRCNIKGKPWIKYWMVPMARITNNDLLLKNGFKPVIREEPQIIFRCDAREEFNPDLPYGQLNKVALLKKLGVPGKWDQWISGPQSPGKGQKANSEEKYEYGHCGWVARLNSGNPAAENSYRERRNTRVAAIVAFITNLDQSLVEGSSVNEKVAG